MDINTENLRLIPCSAKMLKMAIEGNKPLSKLLGVAIADQWTGFGLGALRYAMDMLSKSPLEYGWWTHFPIHKQDNKLIGCGGYKGRPTQEGTVELGYEIAPAYRAKGLATEMTEGLILNAFSDNRVKSILAHTLGHYNASAKVLEKSGFVKTKEIYDPEDGLIWQWKLNRT